MQDLSKNLFKKFNLRKTKERERILLLFQKERAWTAIQLHAEMPKTNLSTIYRNLQKLSSIGIIKEAFQKSGESYYEMQDKNHHDHRTCSDCKTSFCIPCPTPNLKNHHLELFQTCTACK